MNGQTQTTLWPITMTQAAHIARIPMWVGTDEKIAAEYGIDVALVREIRAAKCFND